MTKSKEAQEAKKIRDKAPISFRFSPEMKEDIETTAKRLGLTRNGVVVKAVVDYLVKECGVDPNSLVKKRKEPKPSLVKKRKEPKPVPVQTRTGVGLEVWKKRKKLGYSLEDMAKIAGVCRTPIVNLEHGKKISKKSATLILKALNLDYLFESQPAVYFKPSSKTPKGRVGLKVRQRRIELGYSQEELAKIVGVSHTTVGKLERGEEAISSQNFCSILKALDLNPDMFA